MRVRLFRKKEKATVLLFEQRNNGTAIQDVYLPRQKILSNRRKMSNNPRAPRTEEERRFKFIIRDSLLNGGEK
jgi:hypothetical protein